MVQSPRSLGRSESPRLPSFIESRVERYTERVTDVWGGRHLFHQEACAPGSVALHTNDYLQLSCHPEVVSARRDAVDLCRDPSVMSAVFLADSSPQRTLETELARFMGSEDAVLCQSGWAANVGLLQAIAGPETPVYLDFFAHMSLREGAECANAPIHSFRHNDLRHLDRCISRHGPGIIAVDSLYSTLGTLCPLTELARLAEKRRCVLIVDESHTLGTHGPQGAGLVADLDLGSAVLFRTSSLSKTFGARGGCIACPESFVDYFRLESRIAIFSSAVHSYEAWAFLRTLQVLRESDEARAVLRENAAALRRGLAAHGYPVGAGTEQIIALETGSEHRTLHVRDVLAERGIQAAPFLPPATPANRCLLRMTVTSGLNADDVARVIDVFGAIRDEVNLPGWTTRRRRRGLSAPRPRLQTTPLTGSLRYL